MPVTVIVGGQFGSEGKGKVACEFARMQKASVAVRTGGSNSGHTVIDQDGTRRVFRHLPTSAILDDVICVIGSGTYLDVEVLLREIAEINFPLERLLIDENAVIISDQHKEIERASGLIEGISSTGSGTGAALVERIQRGGFVTFAKDDPRLPRQCLGRSRQFLRQRLNRNERIILEGTQGFGLSVLHSSDYPNVTSRDTTAAAFVSESGMSPLDVDEVVLVLRAFPIRVAGDSGHLPNEIDWETVTRESGSKTPIVERTSVTGKIRRVGGFDPAIVKAAIEANAPTKIVINHMDYIDAINGEVRLTDKAGIFIGEVENQIEGLVDYLGYDSKTLVKRHADGCQLLCA